MYDQLLISAGLVVVTTFLHAIFIGLATTLMRLFIVNVPGPIRFIRDLVALVLVGLWLMFAHFVEIAAWAYTYLHYDVVVGLETAFYFSSVCYTTLGLGGVEVAEEWKLLPGANAANGLLLFGISAAFLVDMKNKLGLNQC